MIPFESRDDSDLTVDPCVPLYWSTPDLQPRDTGDVIIEPFNSQSARLHELPIPNGNPVFIGNLGSF